MERNAGSLNERAREAWDANAEWWDDQVGAEGNHFHRTLIAPAQVRLLDLKPGEIVLDIACGNGQFAREMARLGASVVAFDFSAKFLQRAKEHTREAGLTNIEYRHVDATDEKALLALGERSFDAAVCTMALMDMAEVGPLLRSLTRLLKPGGRFVFSVMHPCFNSAGIQLVAETDDREGDLTTSYSVRVRTYLDPGVQRGIGIVGQPQPQLYFHRPLSELLGACFAAGFVLDGLDEPAFPPGFEATTHYSWANYPQIPPVLVARLRTLA